ncbi:hypothetical protein GLAREA_10025 [Glarea lozoyensis ATCC 20868]|uniref:Uncharacterized protein n=1 Tax=Glarea lozoyensis (strain ATCC 20868 / MF5171) TaxID=1116229 RepID=S3DQN3_GLAL2|nr:uncharacterized protein GLAREA_10025 [Glarea lozoyensis ATCC 20868]EPE34331.1 hypothetical protein GLAREA_10025 [Glarea lozoyensis ATCC 20868]
MHISKATVCAALFITQASALCTEWKPLEWTRDDFKTYSNVKPIELDSLYCDENRTESCFISKKTYNITAPRRLESVARIEVERDLDNTISPADKDNIFQLAASGHNLTFMTRNTVLESSHLANNYSEVKPGINMTLGWKPLWSYSTGVLGACTNASLDGLRLTAVTPYMVGVWENKTDGGSVVEGQSVANGEVLAGIWTVGTSNLTQERINAEIIAGAYGVNSTVNGTEDGKSAAGMVGVSVWSWVAVGVGIACGFACL